MIKLYPRQHDFFVCPDRFAAFIGGIGSGKSFVGALKGISRAKPRTVGLVVAPTYPMLRDATLRTYRQLLGDDVGSFQKSDMILTVPGGGEVLFRSADNPDRLRGPNIHWAHIDEAGLCPRETWDIVIGRLRADGGAGPCDITTTPKGRNWLYERQSEMTVFRAATRDNPYLSREFVESLECAYTGQFKLQELEGLFVAFEGLVYPDFNRAVHVHQRQRGEMVRFLLATDEGYTNPAVVLDIGVDNDGRVHIFREWYRRGQLQDAVVAINKAWADEAHPSSIVVDASAAGLIAALIDAGLPAEAHKGRVQDGIAQVQNALARAGDGRPRLTVDPSCIQTIAEFESYCWKEGKDEPVKQSDHAMDALRYGVDAIQVGTVEAVTNPFYD